jgi:AraC-like DNA-binding protein/quercetin dioxygenase-like cupin family protein
VSFPCGALRSKRTPLFHVEEFDLAAGYRMRRHTHVGPGIVVGLTGAWIAEVGRREHACGPGDLVILPDAAAHRERCGASGARCLLLTLADPSGLEPGTSHVLHRDRRIAGSGAATLGVRIVRELARTDALGPDVIEGLALDLFAALDLDPEEARREPGWLARVREALDAGFLQGPDVGALAIGTGRSREHVHRRFRRAFGVSPGAYVRARRLDHAAHLLVDGELSVAAVAAECGFTDQSHLTRLFRARFGTTPGRYRARGRAPAGNRH